MKKILKTLCLGLGMLAGTGLMSQPGQAPKPVSALQLKVIFDGFGESQEATLVSQDNQQYRSPSVKIVNYQCEIKTVLPTPGVYLLMVGKASDPQQSKYFSFFLDNEPTSILGLSQGGDYVVGEGTAPKAFKELLAGFGPDFDALTGIYRNLRSAGTMNYNPDSLSKLADERKDMIAAKVSPFLTKYSKSAVAPFLLFNIIGLEYPYPTMEAWLAQIDKAALNNPFGQEVTTKLADEKLLGYGQPAPVFVQNSPDGSPVSLESFKGKYVLIDFWASWCGPCRQENPNVVRAFERFKSKNFTVLGVSLDKDKQKWLQAISDDGLSWTQVSDLGFWNNAAAKLYKVSGIPQNFLIDPDGKIIGKNLRGPALDSFLEKVLGE